MTNNLCYRHLNILDKTVNRGDVIGENWFPSVSKKSHPHQLIDAFSKPRATARKANVQAPHHAPSAVFATRVRDHHEMLPTSRTRAPPANVATCPFDRQSRLDQIGLKFLQWEQVPPPRRESESIAPHLSD
jgi:hypothetical protein